MMAPPLAGSPRVQGHRDYVIKVLLEGADRSARRQDLPRRHGADGRHRRVDRRDRVVRPHQLRQQRRPGDAGRRRARARRDGGRKTPWTLPELEASLPRPLDSQQWKLTASHGAETAAGGATLRGWTSGAPQAPGMWFAVELPQPAMVTEVQFDSMTLSPRQGRGGPAGRRRVRRRLAGGRCRPCRHRSSAIRAATRCRCRRTARSGASRSPRARATARTRRSRSRPARAKFVRITQTDDGRRRAGVVDPQPAHLRGARGTGHQVGKLRIT